MGSSSIYGVDFSGSSKPGNVIWIAEGEVTGSGTVVIDDAESAKSRDWGRERDEVYRGFQDFISSTDEGVFGLDVPLGFPEEAVDVEDWAGFIEWFYGEFEDESIADFPRVLDIEGHPKREHDVRYGGQSPFSPQVRYMVFHGLRDLIHPLVNSENVSVRPMGPEFDGAAEVIEVYPAATFGRHGLYRAGYKGRGEDERCRRRVNFEGLNDLDDVEIAADLEDATLDSDDALDSICAAVAAGHAVLNGIDGPTASVEGHIYV